MYSKSAFIPPFTIEITGFPSLNQQERISVQHIDKVFFDETVDYLRARIAYDELPSLLGRLVLIPFSDLPLFVNDKNWTFKKVVMGRLRIGF